MGKCHLMVSITQLAGPFSPPPNPQSIMYVHVQQVPRFYIFSIHSYLSFSCFFFFFFVKKSRKPG
ncbi:hypothetical protein ACKS23_03240 [Histoplasma ohiense]